MKLNVFTYSYLVLLFYFVTGMFFVSIAADSTLKIVSISEVNWEQLNPARGDKSPRAGTLWGDRNGKEATGFLVKFVDGFSSPPHIHNVAYRGVVISGHIHNDDPDAEPMWMPVGSFWTQPAGEVHITAAQGTENIAYIEIDKAPYLVLPRKEAFDSGERPVNVDQSNLVWIERHASDAEKIEIAYLWGKPQKNNPYGVLVKIPAEMSKTLHNHGNKFHAVVISGQLQYHLSSSEIKNLDAGSYFSVQEASTHKISNKSSNDLLVYVHTNGNLDFLDE